MEDPCVILEDAIVPEAEGLVYETIMGIRKRKEKKPIDGGYIMPDEHGEEVAVFKREGVTADKEFAAYVLDFPPDGETDGHGLGGVPITTMVLIKDLDVVNGTRTRGSLQRITNNALKLSSWESDISLSDYQVQKLSLIDIRYGNSRTTSDLLVKEEVGGEFSLVPINHGECFPEEFESHQFPWPNWNQALEPYCEEIDLLKDVHKINLGEEAEFAYKVRHMVMKTGVSRGFTAHQIGTYMLPTESDEDLKLANAARENATETDDDEAEAELLELISAEISQDFDRMDD